VGNRRAQDTLIRNVEPDFYAQGLASCIAAHVWSLIPETTGVAHTALEELYEAARRVAGEMQRAVEVHEKMNADAMETVV
jgi:hypothetical protein